jgi:hypothetical protein
MAKGLLIASFDFSTAYADEFHDWYDLEHVPEREAVFGFGACERWMRNIFRRWRWCPASWRLGVTDPKAAVIVMSRSITWKRQT